MAKNKTDYFTLLEQQVGYCAQAADLLLEILATYAPENIQEYRQKMHEIENTADTLRNDIIARLAREFITPIDQEDILRLAQIIDDVTDALDETVGDLYMYHIPRVPKEAQELVQMVKRSVTALQSAIHELRNYKKSEKLRGLLVEVNSIESEADDVYTEAVHALFGSDADMREIIGDKAIYDSLENCCDLCEHAADVIEHTIMKNA